MYNVFSVHTAEIIGGHEAVPHSRPYMVLLQRHVQANKIIHCDGFLLNEDFVMTAAHCQARLVVRVLVVITFYVYLPGILGPLIRFISPTCIEASI